MVKNLPANAGDAGDSWFDPWVRKIPGGGNDNPLQYSCLDNPMDRGARWATAHGVSKSQTRLSTPLPLGEVEYPLSQTTTTCTPVNRIQWEYCPLLLCNMASL